MAPRRLNQFLRPSRLLASLRQRGVAGTWTHAVRKAGALAGRALVGPQLLRLTPMGAVCNHACPMCWRQHVDPTELKNFIQTDRELGLRLADYVRLFDGLPPGMREINLVGGGEPLIHPEILPLMREIKRRGWRGSLISNATLLTPTLARQMVEMRWDLLRVSVHAGDAETYRRIHGVNRYQALLDGLSAYHEERRRGAAGIGCRLVLCHVLQHENIPSLDRLFGVAEAAHADAIDFDTIVALDPASQLGAEELAQARRQLAATASRCAVPCNLDDMLRKLTAERATVCENQPFRPAARCSVGFDEAFINSVGEVMPCCFSDEVMGNLRRQTFREIWRGERYRDFRRRLIAGRFAPYCIRNHCALRSVLHD